MTMHGFELISSSPVLDYGGTVHLYRHSSGLEAAYFDADDEESFFAYLFSTPPEDSTGVFHIIEHTVLSGCEKFPLKDPFSTFSAGSCNTYMNAFTCPDRTVYPASSTVRKDFDNLFLLYTDSVFRPLLRKETFLQEGIRISGGNPDGVVFNEMKSDYLQMDTVVGNHAFRDLFTSSCNRYAAGGKPEEIVTLTYEKYLDTYKRFYTPANCKLFVYGSSSGFFEKLEFLDSEYLPHVKTGVRMASASESVRWNEPRSERVHAAAEDGHEGLLHVASSYLLDMDGTSNEDKLIASLLSLMLLDSPTSGIYGAMLNSGLCEDISSVSGVSTDFSSLVFTVGMVGVKEGNEGKAKDFLLSAFKDVVGKGIGHDTVEAALRKYEFSLKEIPGGNPNGLRILHKCIRSWECGLPIDSSLHPSDDIRSIRKKFERNPRFFEDWILENIIGNTHRLDIVCEPDPKLAEKYSEKLKEICSSMGDRSGDEELFEAFKKSKDPDVKLPSIDLEDVMAPPKRLLNVKEGDAVFSYRRNTGGITYVEIAINCNDFTIPELRFLSVLSRVLTLTGLKGEPKDKIHNSLKLVTGRYSFYVESGADSGNAVQSFFAIKISCLNENLSPALKLLSALLLDADVGDKDAVKSGINDFIGDYQEWIEYAGYHYAQTASARNVSPSMRIAEEVMGVSAWLYYDKNRGKDFSKEIISVYEKLKNRKRFLIHFSTEEKDVNDALPCIRDFLESIPDGEDVKPLKREKVDDKANVVYTISSEMAHNAVSVPSSPYGSKEMQSELVLSYLMASGPLWQAIRADGGAYGAQCTLSQLERTFSVFTYRDPHLKRSFDGIMRAFSEFKLTPDELLKGKIQSLSSALRPLSPKQESGVAFSRLVYGVSDEMREEGRRMIYSLSVEDVEKSAKTISKRLKSGSFVSLAGKGIQKSECIEADVRKLPRY